LSLIMWSRLAITIATSSSVRIVGSAMRGSLGGSFLRPNPRMSHYWRGLPIMHVQERRRDSRVGGENSSRPAPRILSETVKECHQKLVHQVQRLPGHRLPLSRSLLRLRVDFNSNAVKMWTVV
jgi:hypothetical protein